MNSLRIPAAERNDRFAETAGGCAVDEFLKIYADRYERWRDEGDFTISSKILPVREALVARQWVLPGEQVLRVLANARSIALADCVCRTHYARCDKPRDVCLLIDDIADRSVERGRGRHISLSEASGVLQKADEHGLVHMTLYMPGRKIYALCSCCPCCCHDLQLLQEYGRRDLVARSDYIAVTDRERCTDCGLCIERCMFGARSMQNGVAEFDARACLGCGLCVSVCPESAIELRVRQPGS